MLALQLRNGTHAICPPISMFLGPLAILPKAWVVWGSFPGPRPPPFPLCLLDGHVCRFWHHDGSATRWDHPTHPVVQPLHIQDQVQECVGSSFWMKETTRLSACCVHSWPLLRIGISWLVIFKAAIIGRTIGWHIQTRSLYVWGMINICSCLVAIVVDLRQIFLVSSPCGFEL